MSSEQDSAQLIVAAGIIWSPDRKSILLTLRKPEQHQGDRWEFPGGKLESGESLYQCLCRELQEELNLQVQEAEPFRQVSHTYTDANVVKPVLLHFWQVFSYTGKPLTREGQLMRWVPLPELAQLEFPDANRVVVQALLDSM